MVGNRDLSGVVVLGMDRSGTSATTRMFERSGFFVGADADLIEADEANPTGYFENRRVWRVNEDVLREVGYSLNAPTGLERLAARADLLKPLREVMDHLLTAAGSLPLALKDPRISMLIRLWRPLFEGVLHPVLFVRHPYEVALSLERRDGTAAPLALALWEHRLSLLVEGLDGAEVSIVPYSRVLSTPCLAGEIVADVVPLLRPVFRDSINWAKGASAFEPHIRRSHVRAGERVFALTARQQRLWKFADSLGAGLVTLKAPHWLGKPEEKELPGSASIADAR